jgi:hypothetical protein
MGAFFWACFTRPKKPGFPLQFLGFAYANPAGFPLQFLARAPAHQRIFATQKYATGNPRDFAYAKSRRGV